MKLLMLASLAFISLSLMAQKSNNYPDGQYNLTLKLHKEKIDTVKLQLKNWQNQHFLTPGPQFKPGIHILPLDHMPCLVPDAAATVKMPNAWNNATQIPIAGRIPNPARPLNVIPPTKLP